MWNKSGQHEVGVGFQQEGPPGAGPEKTWPMDRTGAQKGRVKSHGCAWDRDIIIS